MKLSLILLALTELALTSAASCNRDNCLRAAIGTAGPNGAPASRLSACSSFQSCTVTPPVTTSTTTVTVAGSAGCTAGAARRDQVEQQARRQVTAATSSYTTVCPTSVPRTASACSGTSRFASACSCGGVTKALTTVPASTVTTTQTVTSCTTSQAPFFSLQVGGLNNPYDGQYANIQGLPYPGSPPYNESVLYYFISEQASSGLTLYINQQGVLYNGDYIVGQIRNATDTDYVNLAFPSDYPQIGPLTCTLTSLSRGCAVHCVAPNPDNVNFQMCPPDANSEGDGVLKLGGDLDEGCYLTVLYAVFNGNPAC